MDTSQKIALGASLMCLFVALMAIWCERFQAACRGNVGKTECGVADECCANEALRKHIEEVALAPRPAWWRVNES